MTPLKKHFLQEVEKLGDRAPEFFGRKQSTINVWKKTGQIPLEAYEKVYAINPLIPSASDIEQSRATVRQSSVSVVPPRNPDPMMPPPASAQVAPEPTLQPRPPYTIENAQADIATIVAHFNNTISPIIEGIKNQGEVNANSIASINEQLRALSEWKAKWDNYVPSQQQHAPTVAQLMASQPSDQFNQLATPNDLPSRLNPAAKAQVIQEFHPPQQTNGNNLDTGLAPSAEDRSRSLGALADRQDPRNPGRPAGPATPPPQDAPGMPGWTRPWPVQR